MYPRPGIVAYVAKHRTNGDEAGAISWLDVYLPHLRGEGRRMKHALFSASGSLKWIKCAAALAMEKGKPDTSGEAARIGESGHKVSECCLLNRIKPMVAGIKGDPTRAEFYIGSVPVEGGVVFLEDYAAPANHYVDTVWSRYTRHRRNLLFTEQRVNYSKDIRQPKSFGTSDTILLVWDVKAKHYILEIHDLKFGMGVKVDANNNSQLMLYALGALRKYGKKYPIGGVRMFIHQPRISEVPSEWEISIEGLLQFAKYATKRAALAWAVYENGPKPADFTPSEDGCMWCKARDECKARAKFISEKARGAFPKLDGDEVELTDQDLAMISADIPEMKKWISDVETKIKDRMKAGVGLPGRKLVADRAGTRKYTDDVKAAKILARAGVALKSAPVSPADAEKLLKKAHPKVWKRLQRYITQGDPSLAVVDSRDPRPSWNVADKSDFEIED